jgi:uncharacterized membrane protein
MVPMEEHHESSKRSIFKSISFRVISVFSMLAITLLILGNIIQATSLTLAFQGVQTVFYLAHERAWAHFFPAGYFSGH